MGLKKGFIRVLEGARASEEIEVLYYPAEYSTEKSNVFSEVSIPGLESPYIQFLKGNAVTLSLEIFYDTYEKGIDVRIATDHLTTLMNLDPHLHAPPPLLFLWGLRAQEPFFCILEQVTRRFTMFLPSGIPVRARLSVRLREFKRGPSPTERALQSRDRTKVYRVKQGDTLWLIAHREYGDASRWNTIAKWNMITDPRFLAPGRELILRPLE
ncbi:MAG: peptidoglycan-binding protein [Methanoculleus sp. SDB]|nr:MAG: peptidoglycan-binding protein [Methanoculleus sp. SDB]